MPEIRIANGELFDPWRPELTGEFEPTGTGYPAKPNWDWLGHHLANECRFAGGCTWFYSVAQHSVLASRYVEYHFKEVLPHQANDHKFIRNMRLAALLHDVTEAVLKDIPSPYKHSHTHWARGYRQVEKDLLQWFYEKFGILEYLNAPPIKAIDKELLDAERHVLFSGESSYAGSIRIEPWDREYARDAFNRALRSLCNGAKGS